MKRPSSSDIDQHYDLLVCGGGIYGAWTAYDAALRGLKVIIIEQNDWCSGTSSASSKLVHGGLRYLEILDLDMVKKSLIERQHLITSAPYRVWPLRFGIPVSQHSRFRALRLKMGLILYDFLAGTMHSKQTHRYFNSKAFSEHFPCLDDTQLKCGYTYLDAQTDDARLVLEIIDGAQTAGATCLNYCRLQEVIKESNLITGAVLHNKIEDKTLTIKTSTIAKTTGQWIADSAQEKQWGRLSKGVHLVLPKILEKEALLLTAKSDGRVFFVIPWYGKTLLGTTDTNYSGDINDVTVEKQDIDYLLSEVNFALKTQWTESDIQGQFAGLRVLQCSTQQSPSSVSRDWQLKSFNQGLLYSIGGKLTSSREDVGHIVDAVCHYLGNHIDGKTLTTPMPWLPEQNFKEWQQQTREKAQTLGVDDESILWLLRRHGKHVAEILLNIDQDPPLAQRIMPHVPLIVADLLFCLKNEMVIHLEDLLRRRVPLLILHRMTDIELNHLAQLCSKELKWDQATIDQEIESCASKWLLH